MRFVRRASCTSMSQRKKKSMSTQTCKPVTAKRTSFMRLFTLMLFMAEERIFRWVSKTRERIERAIPESLRQNNANDDIFPHLCFSAMEVNTALYDAAVIVGDAMQAWLSSAKASNSHCQDREGWGDGRGGDEGWKRRCKNKTETSNKKTKYR